MDLEPSPPVAAQPAFPVVGIGASAGGFPALAALLQNLPPASGMALVVVLHLPRHEASSAAAVLQRATGQPVIQVSHTTRLQADHVYVIPPDRNLRMVDGHLLLSPLAPAGGPSVVIDHFFRTLGEAHREFAIGVVLSGMGADGTAGLAAIREAAGVTIAQLPSDADEGAMPRAAIDAGMVDFVLAAAQIPAKLIELRDIARRVRQAVGREASGAAPFATEPALDAALQGVLATLRTETGHDFTQYKPATLLRRIERRLQVRGVADLPAYLALLRKDGSEPKALLRDLLVGVTSFFRDRESFDTLERLVVPRLLEACQPGQQVRIWVAACSTGEEAYSLAIQFADGAAALPARPAVQVFASDLDGHAVEMARTGLYPPTIADDVPARRLDRYFVKESNGYRAGKALQEDMLFARHNLLQDPAFSRVDLISCRNFLIYLNREMHRQVLQRFHFALNPGGYLFLGNAESADVAPDLFTPVSARHRIYQAIPGAAAGARVLAPATLALPWPEPAPLPASPPAKGAARTSSIADIHREMLAEFAPASLLVNGDGQIVHVGERTTVFLRQVGGELTRDLVAQVLPELQGPLQAALFRVRTGVPHARTGPVHFGPAGAARAVDMVVSACRDEQRGALMLVQFQELHDLPPAHAADPALGAPSRRLEDELWLARRTLRETIDQAEAFGAEMRAWCEQLQTTVAELRAAAVEADREKAQLLSGRLEVAAINEELRYRVEQTEKAHDDLRNLVASSDVATVFLDNALRILRYTPRFADIFNVIPADVGRPLPDITSSLIAGGLMEQAFDVFQSLQPLEREVQSRDGKIFLVRMHPYRTAHDRIEGAVMTLFDITWRKAAGAFG